MDRLAAVNRILVSAQLEPVASLTGSLDRLETKAVTMLDDAVLRELEKGWDFNTDHDYPLTLSAGNFNVPTTPWTVLALDVRTDQSDKEIVVRDGKLYDKTNRTFTFTEATIDVDITWKIDFDNCPLAFQEQAVAFASVRFAVQVAVDPQTASQLREDKAEAKAQMRHADTQQAELSIYRRWPLNWVSRRWPRLNK